MAACKQEVDLTVGEEVISPSETLPDAGKTVEGKDTEEGTVSEARLELTYEQDLDEKRFLAFKDLMKHSEVYTEYLKQRMAAQSSARKFEWNRKQALMKTMAAEYAKNNIPYHKFIMSNEVPDAKDEDPFSVLEGEMLNSAGQVVSMKQPFSLENATMRPYQIEGLNWLKTLFEHGINGILADEMGLGKTIQSIAVIAHLYEMGVSGNFMIVAPLSTLYNWIAEFQRFAPKIPVLMYHGSKDEREKLRKKFRSVKFLEYEVSPVIVTSYEIVIIDGPLLKKMKWRYLIVDEGHRLKNFQCRLIRELKALKASCRLLLTGTPLQNNLAELWSLMNFLLPEVFDDAINFQSWFDADGLLETENCNKIITMEREQQVLSTMHRILRPFVLRRKKDEVEINLPPKKEVHVYAPMTELQKTYYQATLDKNIYKVLGLDEAELEEEVINFEEEEVEPPKKKTRLENGKGSNKYGLRSTVPMSCRKIRTTVTTGKSHVKMGNCTMQLRKITNHPYLIHFPYHPDTEVLKIDEELVKSCGKLMVLDAILQKLKKMGHKILLFSQMTSLMDILEDYLDMRKYKCVRFDGSTTAEDRQTAIKKFNDTDAFIFLLSTRAGGLGINLTVADTVIIYDSDWNPQCDFQAIDRCHRIGQNLPVVVYRLITSGTIDERIVEMAKGKTKLEEMVIGKGELRQKTNGIHGISIQELQELLNTKDTKIKIQPNGLVFSDEELDCLLDRNAILNGGNNLSILMEKNTPMKKTFSNRRSRRNSPDSKVKSVGKSLNRLYKIL